MAADGFETRAIHAGQEPDPTTGAVVPPINLATTYAQNAVGETRDYFYARAGNPTRRAYEECVSSLEGARVGLAFASGMAAEDAVLRLLEPGDNVIVSSDVYGGTFLVLTTVHARAGIDCTVIDLTDVDDAEVIVIGGACDEFTYATLNKIFRRLMHGAALVGMHRNLFWKTAEGWELDGGAYLAGLEEAADVRATICGKPEKTYFDAGLAMLGVTADRAAMVGDDVVNDIIGAQEAGLTGILVRTGKFRPGDELRDDGRPDHILDSFAAVPDLLGSI